MASPRGDDDGSYCSGQETSGSVGSLDSPEAAGRGGPSRRPREDTPPAPCAAFCGPRTCNTLPPNLASPHHATAAQASEPKRRRLWGLRGLVKMFRRRVRRRTSASTSPEPAPATLRARSTSELQMDQSHRTSVGPYNQGLSVSHDSVFSPDTPSGANAHTPPALVIATRGVNMAELKAALRRRGRGEDSGSGDDDLGLPRSPPTSPTTLDVLNHGLKSCSRATQSTCSDGSLLSMGSSENDEDSLGIGGSHHSSNLSLLEARQQVIDHEPVAGAVPLNHQAARHKMSLKPKRTYATPRSRKSPQAVGGSSVLPVTPEVNEDASHKNQTSPPHKKTTSSSLTSSPLTISSQTSLEDSSGIGTCSTGSGQERRLGLERRESEKKIDEKKDESLIGRFFGSVRRKTNESVGDKSREGSPLQKESEQRSSKEKRRDSSGSRFPLLGRSSSRVKQQEQQEQQQQIQNFALPPTGRGRDTSRDRKPSQENQTSPNQQSHRSASVEGRLENTQPPSFRISAYEERSNRSHEVRKVKSFRELEVPKPAKRDWVHVKDSPNKQSSTAETNICSALLDSHDDDDDNNNNNNDDVDDDDDNDISSAQSSTAHNESCLPQETPPPLGTRTSTDSLTSTNIPGVFIRQQSGQSLTKLNKNADHQQIQQESTSGPLSLDSSISVSPKESEESLRNAVSVDHMTKLSEQRRVSRGNDSHTNSIKIGERRSSSGSKITLLEKKASSSSIIKGELNKDEQNKISGQVLRSLSIKKCTEELENENEISRVPLRPVKREQSLKRVPSREVEQETVPEFMRIQLNRVENKGHTTIFDTEQENLVDHTKEVDASMIIIDSTPTKDYQRSEIVQEKVVPSTKENKSMGSLPKEKSSKKVSKNTNELVISGENLIESIPKKIILANKKEDSFHAERSVVCSTESINIVERSESMSPEPTSVILRRPLVMEKALMDRAQSVSSPSPVPSEQPELFKVFARRSFKDKNSDKEKDEIEVDESVCAENASEVSELTFTQSISSVNTSGSAELSDVSISPQGLQTNQKPTSLNAISFNNRMSVGNPTLSFRPPPITTASVTTSPGSTKPVVLVLSSGSNEATLSNSSSVSTTIISTDITSNSSCNNISGPTQVRVNSTFAGTNATINSDSSVTSVISESNSANTSQVNSKIISNSQLKTQTSISESADISPSSSQSTTIKPLSNRNSSSQLWPRRNQQQDDAPPVSPKTPTTPTLTAPQTNSSSPQSKGTMFTASNTSDDSHAMKIENKGDPVEVAPLDINAARRRFMSGGNKESQIPSDKMVSIGSLTAPVKSSTNLAEARNVVPTFTITVRTQQPSGNTSTNESSSVTENSTIENINSVGGHEDSNTNSSGVVQQVAEDWRVLVRQRRDERRKSTKTPDAEELLIEASVTQQVDSNPSTSFGITSKIISRSLMNSKTKNILAQNSEAGSSNDMTRPPASRNSKVLEMASNFQKLQVA